MKKSRLLLLLLGVGMIANAIAAPPQEPLTVTVQGDGTVMSEPAGISCPSDCNESYKRNTTITLTATAGDSSFLGWEGACIGTQPTCEVKISAPSNVTAVFDATVVTPIAPVLKTGQTTCWDTLGTEIDCTGTGQDGDLQTGAERSYTDNGDGTITDNATGLMWEKNVKDTNSINHCNTPHTWDGAFLKIAELNAANFAGYNDWRLPNVNELQSLVVYGRYPAIDPVFNNVINDSCTWFFDTPSGPGPDQISPQYWSSTTSELYPDHAWGVSFNFGTVIFNRDTDKPDANQVRAVRNP